MSDIWDRAYQRHAALCTYCDRDLLVDFDSYMSGELDHLVPVKWGGSDADSNLVLACNVCNRLKGDFDPRSKGSDLANRVQLIESSRAYVKARRAKLKTEFDGYAQKYDEARLLFAKSESLAVVADVPPPRQSY